MSSEPPVKQQTDPRAWLFWTAIALAVAELINAFSPHNDLAGGTIYAILVAACAWWLRVRGSRRPVIILFVLAVLELVAVVFIYPHSANPPALWRAAIFFILTAAVVVLSVLSLSKAKQ